MAETHGKRAPIVEIVTKTDQYVDKFSHANDAFKAVAGTRAFRNYDWMHGIASTNAGGNFRGMVLSSRWKTIFHYSSKAGEYLENLGTLASLAATIAEMGGDFDKVVHSNTSITEKGLRLTELAGTAAEQTLVSAVPSGVHLIYMSLQGYCMMAGLIGGKMGAFSNRCVETLDTADVLVHASFKALANTHNQAHAVLAPRQAAQETFSWVVDLKFLPRK